MSTNQPKRILISRLSAIGDCVETMPVASALKRNWPDCEITWIVDCAAEQLLKIHPAVDRVIRVRKGFLKKPSSILSLRRQLRSHQFDLVIDAQGLLKSALVGWLSGAPRRIGFDSSQARERAWWFYTDRVRATADHLVDRHMQLLEPLGVSDASVSFGMPIPDSDANWCKTYLKAEGLRPQDFVLINPGAGWASRRWPADRFGKVCEDLWARFQMRSLIVWSGDSEYELASEIHHYCPSALIAPNTSLTQLTAVIASCRFVVTSDTGPMHMAAAIGKPCVALFGITKPSHCGPYGPGHIVIQKGNVPEMTSRERRNCDNSFMCRIQASDVTDACCEMLSHQNHQSYVGGQLVNKSA
jgi:heptosyltransferase I